MGQGTGLPSLTSVFDFVVVGWSADLPVFGSPGASSANASKHNTVILMFLLLRLCYGIAARSAASGQHTHGGEGKYGFFLLVPCSENHYFSINWWRFLS